MNDETYSEYPDVAAFDAAHGDKITHRPTAEDIANFNAALADFDALTNYSRDCYEPADIADWMRRKWGERNTLYITFCTLAKRLGYEV